MSRNFQQIELSESDIQREIDAVAALIAEDDEDDGNSFLQNLDQEDPADRSKSLIACQLDASGGGIDVNTTSNWIFPVQNYEKRKYQLEISKSALFQNTLVILPTGLGKTFIASVAIYNFMRFFPRGKVIFMAPTRPLVNQQMIACYDIVGISKEETAEMTGKIKKEKRVKLWDEKRLFFCTPQTLQSDIEDQTFPAHLIKLVVFDEAHKAKGNYAYCEVIKAIRNVQNHFRVLALTATAGKSADTKEIIKNLLISKIEYREENSLDVRQYTHKKNIDCIEVKFTREIRDIIDRFMEFVDPNIQKLRDASVVKTFNVSRGYLIMQVEILKQAQIPAREKSVLTSLLSTTIALYNSLEMLQRFGVHLFLKSFREGDGNGYKYFVNMDRKLKLLVEELNEQYGNFFDGIHTSNQITDYGHPKFELLKTRLQEYFDNNGAKVLVFCEFRDATYLINTMLQQMKPKVMSQILIGQGGKMTQKDQLTIMKGFREGKSNTLVCTCVAEEGLDIGEVDLVICFDIATKNLTRFVQRIGRTGRKRTGNVLVLASEGREYNNTRSLIYSKDTNNKSVMRNKSIQDYMYKGPSLFPPKFNPQCLEMKFNIKNEDEPEEENTKKKKAKGKLQPKKVPSTGSIKNHFKPVNKDVPEIVPVINEEMEIQEIVDDEEVKNEDCIFVENDIKHGIETRLKDISNKLVCEHLISVATRRVNAIKNLTDFTSLPLNENITHIPFDEFEILAGNSQERQVSRYYDPFNMTEMNRNSSFMPLNTDFIKDNFPESPLKSSPAACKNFTTPLRRLFKDIDHTPLLSDFHPNRKEMFASTPVMKRLKTPAKIKDAFEFLGIVSIDDIFEGCTSFDEINIPKSLSQPVLDSNGRRFLVEVATNEEAKKYFQFFKKSQEKIDKVTETDDDDIEEIGPSQPTTPEHIPENSANRSMKKLIALDNIDELFACDEEMPESEVIELSLKKINESLNSSHLSDKTIEYDVEEWTNIYQKHETKSAEIHKVQSMPSTSFTSPITSRKRPNFSKLITAIKEDSFLTQERRPLHERPANQATPKLITIDHSSACESPASPQSPIVKRKRIKRRVNGHRGFLATQAADDNRSMNSSDEDIDELDNSIVKDFIHDETVGDVNQTHMYAKYVQSLKSPVGIGNFKMPRALPTVNFSQIFSQMPQESESEEDSDMDSFVVNTQEVVEEEVSELDELEIAERELRERKKRRKRQMKDGGTKKRKIVRRFDSSSDEDEELKKMRQELLN